MEQQATATAASTSTEWGNLVRMLGEVGSRDRVDPQALNSFPNNMYIPYMPRLQVFLSHSVRSSGARLGGTSAYLWQSGARPQLWLDLSSGTSHTISVPVFLKDLSAKFPSEAVGVVYESQYVEGAVPPSPPPPFGLPPPGFITGAHQTPNKFIKLWPKLLVPGLLTQN